MLAGWTPRRPGVAIAEGSGSSERRRRRVVAAVAARATCIDGLLTGRGANEALRQIPSAIHQYILSSPGICGGGADTDFTRISHRDSGFPGGSGAGPGVF